MNLAPNCIQIVVLVCFCNVMLSHGDATGRFGLRKSALAVIQDMKARGTSLLYTVPSDSDVDELHAMASLKILTLVVLSLWG